MSEPERPAESLGADIAELVEREVERVTESLRQELERLRAEAAERAQEAGRGAGLLGAAGGLGLLAAGSLASLPLLALRHVLPGWAVALLLFGGSATGAALLARRGVGHLRAAAPDSVNERIDEAADDLADTLRRRTRA